MILINSCTFTDAEFQVEVGRVPLSLLPVANKRLYEHQLVYLKHAFPKEDIFLALPQGFKLAISDLRSFERLGVRHIDVPDDLSTGGAILYAIHAIGRYEESLYLLDAASLITQFPTGDNILGLAKTTDDYPWVIESSQSDGQHIWCGYFAFDDVRLLTRHMIAKQGQFVEAVRAYQQDRPMQRQYIEDWQNFGHINTYFQSRARFVSQHWTHHASCESDHPVPCEKHIEHGVVYKRCENSQRIHAESQWFQQLPGPLKRFTPQLIYAAESNDGLRYATESLALPSLSELYVYGRMPLAFWGKLFRLCDLCLTDFSSVQEAREEATQQKIRDHFVAIVRDETLSQLERYAAAEDLDLDAPTMINKRALPSLKMIIQRCVEKILAMPSIPGVWHGDFCFHNIYYDSRNHLIKLTDPRAMNADGNFALYGDLRYDLAKLTLSVVGLYDHILSGLADVKISGSMHYELSIYVDDSVSAIHRQFLDRPFMRGIRPRDVLPIVCLQLLSAPAQYPGLSKYQATFIANALRIFMLISEYRQ